MKTPFTKEQFFDVFRDYNLAIFPCQFLLIMLAFLSVLLVVKRIRTSNRFAVFVLFFLWIWMGIVYHLNYFSKINNAAYIFGAAFILQSVLFLVFGIAKRKIKFHFRFDVYGITSIIIFSYALLFYPLIGYHFNHIYPASPTFGLPCPTTIFTFGLLLIADKKTPLLIFIIPILWSIIGLSAAINFGVAEDFGLIISGFLAFSMFLYRKKETNQKPVNVF